MRRSVLAPLLALLAVAAAPTAAAVAAPPSNDNYLASLRILNAAGQLPATFQDSKDTLEATTQRDLLDPDANGVPLGGGPPEPTSCGSTTYGKTVWYDIAPPFAGGVELSATGYDTVIAVYEFDPASTKITRTLACQNSGSGPSESLVVPTALKAGRSYTVQIGGAPVGDTFASGALTFGFNFYPDRDADGVLDELPDKCLTRPGVAEFAGCPPTLRVSPSFTYRGLASGGVQLSGFRVLNAPPGARVEARCGRCGLKQTVTVKPGSSVVRLPRFVGRSLPPGASLEVFATRPKGGTGRYRNGAFGHHVRYLVRGGKLGSRRDRCLLPGSPAPRLVCR